jgi:riboflavin kinase/FMN adenylyltransferase
MIVIRDFIKKHRIKDPIVTIGNFDGIHIGHQKIFEALKARAQEFRGTPTVITFDPHPIKVLAPDRDIRLITSTEDKIALLEAAGIKAVCIINFNREFASTEAEDFIKDILVDKLRIKAIIVGHGYVFGRAKGGNTELLRRRGRQYGFKVQVVRYKRLKQGVASSSRIRQLIVKGKVSEAASLLGRAYHINGVVVKGTGRGKSILGIPTANLNCSSELIPPEGVYAVKVSIRGEGKVFDAVANIGNNPTFGNQFHTYEIHLLNYSGDLLGRELRVHFIKHIRQERVFKTPEHLKGQILADISTAREIFITDKTPLFSVGTVSVNPYVGEYAAKS